MDVEVWKAIPGFDGWYDASDEGRIRSWRGVGKQAARRQPFPRLMTLGRHPNGYPTACLRGGGRKTTLLVHRLVLETFVGPCPEGMECRHVNDRTPGNVALSNLAWGTVQENADDRRRHGSVASGERNGSRTKPLRVPRGDRHFSRTMPHRVAVAERHGWHKHPELVPRGEKNGGAKLTPENVANILLSAEWDAVLARKYGVDRAVIRRIKDFVSWSHVTVIGPVYRRFPTRQKQAKRSSMGANNGRAKISETTATQIVAALANGGSPVAISRDPRYGGVSESLVREIKSGRSWKHLPRPTLTELSV